MIDVKRPPLAVDWVRKRIKHGKNAIIAVAGQTGSGKSYISLKLAQLIQPDFSIHNVCFSPKKLIQLVNEGNLAPGSCIILEEAGVLVSSRAFYTQINRAVIALTETFRSSRLILIINLPTFHGLDSRVRALVHLLIQTTGIDMDERRSIAKVQKFHVDSLTGKEYRANFQDARRKVLHHRFKMPTLDLRKEYEAEKAKFRDQLEKQLLLEFENNEILEESRKPVNIFAIVDEVVANKDDFIKEWGGRRFIDSQLLCTKFKLGQRTAKKVKAEVEQKLDMK